METFRAWAVVECETTAEAPVREKLLAVFTLDTLARASARFLANRLPKDADDSVIQVVEFDGETGQEVSRETVEPTHDQVTCGCDRCRLYRRLQDLME